MQKSSEEMNVSPSAKQDNELILYVCAFIKLFLLVATTSLPKDRSTGKLISFEVRSLRIEMEWFSLSWSFHNLIVRSSDEGQRGWKYHWRSGEDESLRRSSPNESSWFSLESLYCSNSQICVHDFGTLHKSDILGTDGRSCPSRRSTAGRSRLCHHDHQWRGTHQNHQIQSTKEDPLVKERWDGKRGAHTLLNVAHLQPNTKVLAESPANSWINRHFARELWIYKHKSCSTLSDDLSRRRNRRKSAE